MNMVEEPEKLVFISGCMATDRDWDQLCEYFISEPLLKTIRLSDGRTPEGMGHFFIIVGSI